MTRVTTWVFVAALLGATPAAAQEAADAAGGSPRWEAAVGGVWFMGTSLGESVATLEQPNGQPFTLFRTETSMDGAPGIAVTVGRYATSRLFIEAAFSYARPGVSTRVTADAEDAPAVTSTITLNQYLAEGSVRWHLARSWGRFTPYIRAGGGYLRQLDSDHAHVETGAVFHAGGGVDRAFVSRPDARIERIGLRLEARVTGRTGGFDVEDRIRIGGAGAVLIFFSF